MQDGILLVLVGVLASAISAGLVLWYVGRQDQERAALIDEALALVFRMIGDVVSEAEVRALASWVYDWAGLSAYYAREDWIELVLRLLPNVERGVQAAPAGFGMRRTE